MGSEKTNPDMLHYDRSIFLLCYVTYLHIALDMMDANTTCSLPQSRIPHAFVVNHTPYLIISSYLPSETPSRPNSPL